MTTYRRPTPRAQLEQIKDEPEQIRDYLAQQGIAAEVMIYLPPSNPASFSFGGRRGIMISEPEYGEPALIIEADTDPTAALQNWTPGISAQRQKLRDAIARVSTYQEVVATWDAGGSPPTAAQVARGLDALATIVRSLAKRMDVG